jgi:phosphatidylserine/phosphatidylglycerophosphate/cardiolipin synthase-like enzyme
MTTLPMTVEPPSLDANSSPEEILRRLGVRDARRLYGALVLRPGSRPDLEQRVQALAQSNERVPDLRAGDLLVRVALGERHGLLAVLVTGDLVDRGTAERRGWQAEGTLHGRFAHVVEGAPRPHARAELWARRVADRAGYLPAGQAVLRVVAPRPEGRAEAEADALVETVGPGHTCRAGEGPPAPEPDPTGRGPHPLIDRGATAARSRRPSVGYAQQCLNEFLARHRAGAHVCANTSAEARAYVAARMRTLSATGQSPLVVDCRFGPATETATKAFQACSGIGRDGQIGAITWPLLEAFAPSSPMPTPVPVPPVPVPAPPPLPGPTLASLEGRYFPPPGGADAAPFSRAATIESIVDGREYFAAIRAQINALQAGDVWYVAGWWVDPDFTFATGGPTLGDLLVDRASAGVDVRVIFWTSSTILDYPRLVTSLVQDGPFYLSLAQRNIRSAELLRARTDSAGRRPLAGRVLADWSPGHAASSHHMKISVLGRSGALTAFAGGIDYVHDRFASPMHRGPSPLGEANGWHDVGARLTGHGADRILETFVTRWTEASTLSPRTYDIGSGSRQFNPAPILALTPPTTGPPPPTSSDTSVSIIRSFPNAKEFDLFHNRLWATLPPAGVHEVLNTFQTAIGAARRYIYIEDQMFDAVASLFPSLVAACARGVRVIALVPGVGDPNVTPAATPRALSNAVRTGIVNRLTPAQRTNLAVWQLAGIFVHSKLILIDDEFLSIGSANFMDRSMQDTQESDDSELTATAVSTGNLVADLRVRLWAEHLRVTDAAAQAELRDLSRSLGFWRPAWGTGITFQHPDTQLVFVGP